MKADRVEGLLAFEKMNGLEYEAQDMHTRTVHIPSRVSEKHVFSRSGFQAPFHCTSPFEAQYLHVSNIIALIKAYWSGPSSRLATLLSLLSTHTSSALVLSISKDLTSGRLIYHHPLMSSLLLTLLSSRTFLAPAPSTTGSWPFPFSPGTTFGSNRPVWTKTLA